MARGQVLAISKRLFSATAISRPPPSYGDHKSSYLDSVTYSPWPAEDPNRWPVPMKSSGSGSDEEKIDCYFKTPNFIAGRTPLEERLGNLLHKCKAMKQLKQVHLQILMSDSNYLANMLIQLSSHLISLDYANKIFMHLPNPNLSSYNTLIKCSIGKSDKIAASAYNRMRNLHNISPDRFTFTSLLHSFASFRRLESGEMVHGHIVKCGFVPNNSSVMNALMDFYVKCEVGIRVVRNLFDEMPERYIVSWNAMISALVDKAMFSQALLVFGDMLLLARCKPDETTLINVLFACSCMNLIEQGKWLDSYIKEHRFPLSVPLGNALLGMFVSNRDVRNAVMVFKKMPKRCIATWGTMMNGLVTCGFCREALELFDSMVSEGLKPDDDVLMPVLTAFTDDERLVGDGTRLVRIIHRMVREFGIKLTKWHYGHIIGIICQAGWVEAAVIILREESVLWEPDPFVWGSVLSACQIHGDEKLLDSLIKDLSDISSDCGPYFMRATLQSYLIDICDRRPNYPSYSEMMVESLIGKIPNGQEFIEPSYVKSLIKRKSNLKVEEENHDDDALKFLKCSFVHARETLVNQEEVYKALESLVRQSDLHEDIDPFQVDNFDLY